MKSGSADKWSGGTHIDGISVQVSARHQDKIKGVTDEVFHATVISATTSQDGVRRQACLHVYNMAYLHPSWAFGPFLPLKTHHALPSSPTTPISGSGTGEEEEQLKTLVNHDLVHPERTDMWLNFTIKVDDKIQYS
jgi:hypothetical protein